MRVFSVVVALVFVGCGAESEDSGAVENDRAGDILALAGDVGAGASVYSASCAGCHGDDGTGGIGSNLYEKVPALSDAELVDIVLEGTGDMIALGTLADQDIADVVAYCGDTFGN